MATGLEPYKYYAYKPNYYAFTTDRGAQYECYFLSYAAYFSDYPDIAEYVFGFNIDLVSEPVIKGIDRRIAETVIAIVADFLSSQVNAVVYVCDPSDGRDAVRFKKFKSWYGYSEHFSQNIIQVSNETEAGGMKIHSALLVHKANPLKNRFIQAYLELTEDEK